MTSTAPSDIETLRAALAVAQARADEAEAKALEATAKAKRAVAEVSGPPPLIWSTVIVRKTEDQRWRLSDTNRKR